MKYHDSNTDSHTFKIHTLLERLKPERSNTHIYKIQSYSRSALQSQNSYRHHFIKQQKEDPLAVDVLHHRNHNLLVFIPSTSHYTKRNWQHQRKPIYPFSKSSKIKSSTVFSHKSKTCGRDSFRVKKYAAFKQDTQLLGTQTPPPEKTKIKLQNFEPTEKAKQQQPKLVKSVVILKGEAGIQQQKVQKICKKTQRDVKMTRKNNQNNTNSQNNLNQTKPLIQSFLVDHPILNQLQQKYKLSQQKLIKSSQDLNIYIKSKSLLEEKTNQLFSTSGVQKVRCKDKCLSFLLNTILTQNPNIIKRLFGWTSNKIPTLVLNYEGCFRSMIINYLDQQDHKEKFIWSQSNSIWTRVLQQALSTLFRNRNLNSITMKVIYQMLTGLVMQQIVVSDCDYDKLLQILQSVCKSSDILLGQTADSELSLISSTEDSLHVRKYVIQTVYSQFRPSAKDLISYIQKNFKTLYLTDLYPNYYFIYRKVEYTLGNDSIIDLQVPEQTTIILQISKQTIAFDARIRLSLLKKDEQDSVEQFSHFIKSTSGFKKQIKLVAGAYELKLSDDKESLREYSFSIVLGIICKKNIGSWIRDAKWD